MISTLLYILLTVVLLFLLAFFLGATNVRFNGKPDIEQIRVACVGDSTTYGTAMPNNFHNSYPAQLQRFLGEGYHVANFGVHGKTVQDINDDSYRRTKQYAQSLSYDADIVVIMMGANDTKPQNWTGIENFKKSYRSLVESYMDMEGKRQIILCTPASIYHMFGDGYTFNINYDHLMEECDFIIQFADEMNMEMIDINEITAGHHEWYEPDSVHPNKKGAHAIAAAVFEEISDDF